MTNATLLHILIASHTLIAALSVASVAYVYYAALAKRHRAKDTLLVLALLWPAAIVALLFANGMQCVMQMWAKQLTGQHTGWVRDIYWLPESWVRLVPPVFTSLYALGIALLCGRRLWNKKR
ncbi:MAG: hypothetical protein KGJ79_02645 [Alphaproteobacteria bacterium]|nr:hypothetical protein [Alphaproteobacteria bacterium]MDE2110013.1 hypothetical protein [Alphaproteobacteria bacterium]